MTPRWNPRFVLAGALALALSLMAWGAPCALAGGEPAAPEPDRSSVATTTAIAYGDLVRQALVFLGILVGVSILLTRGLPRLKRGRAPQEGRRVRVLERVRLEPGKTLYLVDVGGREAVLASTPQTLGEVEGLAGPSAAPALEDFASCLEAADARPSKPRRAATNGHTR